MKKGAYHAKNTTITTVHCFLFLLVLSQNGYRSAAQRGVFGGGALGAIAGQMIGGDTESTLLGAGIGALGGALIHLAGE